MVAGWEDVWAVSVLRLSAYNAFFVDFPADRMWRLTGVGTVLTWREELSVGSLLVEEFPRENETTRLHRLNSVYPRLWWAQKARRIEDRPALALLADPGFDPRREILIAESDADVLGEGWEEGRLSFGDGGDATVEVDGRGPGRLEIRVRSAEPGLLFISENYMPGWRAEWTGTTRPSQPARLPVARAHHAFLAVPVPAGEGTVELAYRPASVRWGIAISGVSWIALLLVLRRQIAVAFGAAWKRTRRYAGEVWRAAFSNLAAQERLEAGRAANGESISSIQGLLADSRFGRLAVTLATVAGFALRFCRLGEQELNAREALSFWFSQLPLPNLIDVLSGRGETYFLASLTLQHYWLPLAGITEFALRSTSAFLGGSRHTACLRIRQGDALAALALSDGRPPDGNEHVRDSEQSGYSPPVSQSDAYACQRCTGPEIRKQRMEQGELYCVRSLRGGYVLYSRFCRAGIFGT